MRNPRILLPAAVLLLGALAWLLFGGPGAGGDGATDGGVSSAGDATIGEMAGSVTAEPGGETAGEGATRIEGERRASRGGTIRGRVIAPSGGAGAGGVEVLALDRHPAFAQLEVRLRDFIEEGFWKPRPVPDVEVVATTLTQPDGTFELAGLDDGRVFLDARSGSWFTRSYPGVRLARAETVGGIEILLHPGGRVRGKVVDARNDPVSGARVVLRPSASAFLAQLTSRSFRWAETRSDDEGRFDLAGVPPGEGYAVTAIAPGMALAQVRQLSVQRGRTTDVVLRGGAGAVIEGVVRRPGGEPAAGAMVGFAYMDLSRVLFSLTGSNPARADEQGRFRVENVGTGHVAVTALAEDLALAPLRDLMIVEGGRYDVELELTQGYAIAGRVVDEAVAPVGGAVVTARTMEQPRGFDLSLVAKLVRYEATTGADGKFVIRGLLSDRMFLEASRAGYLTARRGFRKERDTGELQIVLKRGVYLTGRVVDEDGEPVTRFRVRCRNLRERELPIGPRWGRPQAQPNPYTDRSPWLRGGEREIQDANGEFRAGPIEPGQVRVSVDAPGFVASDRRELTVAAGKDPEPLEFRLTRGVTVRGRVLAPGGAPVGDAQVTWRRFREPRDMGFLPFRINADPEDLDFMAMDATFGSRSAMTNARGEFELPGVEPGTVNVTARHPSYAKGARRGLELTAGAPPVDVVLELTAGGAIEGTVRGLDGKPVKTAMVVALSIANGVVKSATTDAVGFYRLEGLAAGPYVVFKTKLDASVRSLMADVLGNVRLRSTTVRDGKTSRVDIEDRTEGGVDVFGRVTMGGEPLARAVVTLLGQDRAGPLGVGLRTATADEQGRYEIASVTPGSYVCQITRYGARRPEMASQQLRIDDGTRRVRMDLTFPDGEIAGTVTDDAGKPLGGVRLRAIAEDEAPAPGGLIGMMSQLGGASRARSGDGGTFRIRRLPPGRWKIRAEPRGDAREGFGVAEVEDLVLGAGQKLSGVAVVLPRACVLTGVVTDGQGQPVAGASVRATRSGVADASGGDGSRAPAAVSGADGRIDRQTARALMAQLRQGTRSGRDGRFRLRGLLPGSWSIVAEKEGLASPRPRAVVLRTGVPLDVRITMVRAGHVWVRVLGLDGKTLPRGRVRVLNSRGETVGGSRNLLAVMASLFRSKDAGDRSEWIDYGVLPPDTYTLEVTRQLDGGKTEVRSVARTLREGEQARWEVQMSDLIKD